MGLFSLFGQQKNDIMLQEMKDYLENFITEYAAENPDDMPNIAGIFAKVRMMIHSLTPKDVKKGMRANGVNVECAVLNIIQNCALSEIEAVPLHDIFFGDEDHGAFALYMEINEKKLWKGLISSEQYEENKRLGKCLRSGQRPIL